MKEPLDANVAAADQPSFWFGVLNMFPFIFVPAVTLVGVLLCIVMPYLRAFFGE